MRTVRVTSSSSRQILRRFGLGWRISIAIAALWLIAGLGLVLLVTKVVTTTEPKKLTVVFSPEDWEGRDRSDHLVYSPESPEDSDAQAITMISEAVHPMALTKMRIVLATGIFLMVSTAGVGTYFLVRGGLRPIRGFRNTMGAVDASGLNTRVPLQGVEQELAEMAEAFNDMLSRLESDFDQQIKFVSDAAHELRSPLAALRAHLEVVHDRPEATLDDYVALAKVQERTTQRVERLLADLLVLSDSGPISSPEVVTLGSLLEEIREDVRQLAAQREVDVYLKGDLDLAVRGVELLLSRTFSNLLENSILYNRPGGRVVITVDQSNGWAIGEMSDTGVGIAPEDQERMFDRLYRGKQARSLHARGTGLGLSIAKHVIDRHGGIIQLEGSTEQGSTLSVRLPGTFPKGEADKQ